MKSLKHLFGCLTLLAVFAFTACNNKKAETTTTTTTTTTDATKTRAAAGREKALDFKSLASFKKGQSQMNFEEFAGLQAKNVNLVVLYESNAPWAEVFNTGNTKSTGDDKLNGLLSSYELVISRQFELDDFNEGLVLEPNGELANPVEAAREISMIDHVLMVHVKEVPADDTTEETADNN